LKVATLDARVNYDYDAPLLRAPLNALPGATVNEKRALTYRELGVADGDSDKPLDAAIMADSPSTVQRITFHPDSRQYAVLTMVDTPFFIHRDDAIPEDENGFKIQDEDEVEIERKAHENEPDIFHIQAGMCTLYS
jgi:hypothetical protein